MTYEFHKEGVATVAGRQQGRISLGQLEWLGVRRSTVQGWERQGYIARVHRGVYAVGHTTASTEADLWAAVLYAGPGAMLGHGTAAHWRGLIDYAPREIQVSTPRQVPSLKALRVYGRRPELEREFHKDIPVTSIPVTMVDLTATSGPRVVDRALGQLDFQKLLDVDSLLAACGSGRSGAKRLREAIEQYDPRLKYANGRLEEDFYALCKRRQLPLPLLNTYVHDIKVDAHWPSMGSLSSWTASSPIRARRGVGATGATTSSCAAMASQCSDTTGSSCTATRWRSAQTCSAPWSA